MANTQAICTSFKKEILSGIHALGTTVVRAATTADVLKAALFLATATLNAATATYSATGEVSGSGYSAGGVTVTNGTPPDSSGTTAFWTPSASYTFSNVVLATAFDAALLYNSSQGNKAICIDTFPPMTVLVGSFILSMPTNDASTGLIRIA